MKPILDEWLSFEPQLPKEFPPLAVENLKFVFFAGAAAAYHALLPKGDRHRDRLRAQVVFCELVEYAATRPLEEEVIEP